MTYGATGLFQVLVWRDLTVRYKQTVIGVAWAVIRPLLTMVVFTVILAASPNCLQKGAASYPLMVFAGMQAVEYKISSS